MLILTISLWTENNMDIIIKELNKLLSGIQESNEAINSIVAKHYIINPVEIFYETSQNKIFDAANLSQNVDFSISSTHSDKSHVEIKSGSEINLDQQINLYNLSIKNYNGQPDDDMLRLRKLLIKNPNNIIRISISNKFEMLSLLFHQEINILMISETKMDHSFPTEQFIIEGYSKIYRLGRNDRAGGIMLIVKNNLLTSRLDKYSFPN